MKNLAAGNPVIISNSGGMKELVTPECGCIVKKGQHFVTDLGEAIDSLILNQDKTNRLRLHTKKRAALFTSQNYCKRFQELLMK